MIVSKGWYVLELEDEIVKTTLFCVICDVFGLNDVIRSPSYTLPSPARTDNTTQHNTT